MNQTKDQTCSAMYASRPKWFNNETKHFDWMPTVEDGRQSTISAPPVSRPKWMAKGDRHDPDFHELKMAENIESLPFDPTIKHEILMYTIPPRNIQVEHTTRTLPIHDGSGVIRVPCTHKNPCKCSVEIGDFNNKVVLELMDQAPFSTRDRVDLTSTKRRIDESYSCPYTKFVTAAQKLPAWYS